MLAFTNYTPIQPFKEISAYEALWADKHTSFKTLAEMFAKNPGARPSDFVENTKLREIRDTIKKIMVTANQEYCTNLLINGTFDFPAGLKDAKEPIYLLYYCGALNYLSTRCVAIVGTRQPSAEGLQTTADITTQLINDNFTIVSGLAAGIDALAHKTAIATQGGRTIAVLGTPLDKVYPRENGPIQQTIAKEHLLISQVPFYRYSQQDYRSNRLFFLERNKTMSALTEATFIVEAGETSGSLTQATAALYQKRKLFIWDACFYNKSITWPQRFLDKGAIRVRNYADIKKALGADVQPLKN